jgi:hypothetical protein
LSHPAKRTVWTELGAPQPLAPSPEQTKVGEYGGGAPWGVAIYIITTRSKCQLRNKTKSYPVMINDRRNCIVISMMIHYP